MNDTVCPDWSVDRSRQLYGIPAWADGLFAIGSDGHLSVSVTDRDAVSLTELVSQARSAGLRLPMLLRFPSVLQQRARRLQTAFGAAAERSGYAGGYTPVYPIKVNQQRTVVQTLADVQGMGLEAGSKPELIAVLAHAHRGQTIICNGYKDSEYVRLALTGLRLGFDVWLVIEKPHELQLIRQQAARLDIQPRLGVRLRLSASSGGNWQSSGGERAKFGLSASQLIELIASLRQHDELTQLGLLHFHMGSQIPGLGNLEQGIREAGRYLLAMTAAGADIQHLNIGGGLGIDYDGSQSGSADSVDYSAEAYAGAVVDIIQDLCTEHGLTAPRLLSESGRWLTAHHAVMVTDVIATETMQPPVPDPPADTAPCIAQLQDLLEQAGELQPHEIVREAETLMQEGRKAFLAGDLELSDRALLDQYYLGLYGRARDQLDHEKPDHHELRVQINQKLAEKLFINLSIFQSLPDIWGLDQIFPVVPLQRLGQKPGARAVLEDLTCDSDGRIDRFGESGGIARTLAVHADAGPGYLLGIFLVGAYQETLGDIHNLFGDSDCVDVHLDESGYRLENIRSGEEAGELLASVGHAPDQLRRALRRRVAQAGLDAEQARLFEAALKSGLSGYTYLESAE